MSSELTQQQYYHALLDELEQRGFNKDLEKLESKIPPPGRPAFQKLTYDWLTGAVKIARDTGIPVTKTADVLQQEFYRIILPKFFGDAGQEVH